MKTLLPLLCLLATGCTTHRATNLSLPKERATECAANCESLDMKLSAMVVISNSVGCVCEPKDASPQTETRRTAAATASGAILAEEDDKARADRTKQSR
ncbi:hypothetical protein SAMN05444354_12022 [Stigmatella aurantiaca]|uniref:Lipoprotein n=1 Tax=Stigmatella aurantiaca TaxID=41 RepID=A0A1H8A105_STIAU|nr:hypothetical protein [Stigmatella aurantiaca]SEM63594.1 hypothetical protein SAMN05444354_12022 [Stigmatella aurantiaca]